MDFGFTEEQQMYRKNIRKFVDKHIKGEYARDLDEDPSKMFIDEDMWQNKGVGDICGCGTRGVRGYGRHPHG